MLAEICKEVGLPFVHSMQYSDPVCNPCGWKIRNLGQLYQFIKATSKASTPVILDTSDKGSPPWRKSSIRGQRSHPRSKVPRRLSKANQESLSPFFSWRKLKNLKALLSRNKELYASKEVKEKQTKPTSWAQHGTTLQENITFTE